MEPGQGHVAEEDGEGRAEQHRSDLPHPGAAVVAHKQLVLLLVILRRPIHGSCGGDNDPQSSEVQRCNQAWEIEL